MIEARIRKRFPAGPESAGFALDIEFKAGNATTVLFGPSGSGKTLTLDSVAGFMRPDEGRILLDNDILFDATAGVLIPSRKRRCGYVFQNYALFPHMTLRKNLEFAVENRPGLERRRRVNEMLEKFHLAEVSGRRPHEVSGGQKQRCSIARALIGSPRLLLLDEPARGLDAPLRSELYSILRQVRADYGVPILLVTHDLDEALQLGDEMLVMREGRLVQSGTPREVLEEPSNIEVARLLGLYNLLPVEIRALDPGRNSSRLRYQEFDLAGRTFRASDRRSGLDLRAAGSTAGRSERYKALAESDTGHLAVCGGQVEWRGWSSIRISRSRCRARNLKSSIARSSGPSHSRRIRTRGRF